jgi:plasmid maintenance system antidote protein VapI
MNQQEIAKQLGISKSYLSMVVSGKRQMTPELAEKLEPFSSQFSENFTHRITLAKEEVASSNLVFRSIKTQNL